VSHRGHVKLAIKNPEVVQRGERFDHMTLHLGKRPIGVIASVEQNLVGFSYASLAPQYSANVTKNS
jgi:hypothetical protein